MKRIMEAIDQLRAAEPAPVYILIQRAVRMLVASGELAPGQRLPAVRALAQQLEVAINTVARGYAELASEGLIVSRGGAGSVVAEPRPHADRRTDERLQRVARQVVAYGLALGHGPPEIIHAVRAELAGLGRPEPVAGATPFEVLPALPMHALPRTEPGQAVAIRGLVQHGTELDRRELARLERATLEQPFACEEGWVVPSLRWSGVWLRDVLALAGPLPEARLVRVGAGSYVMPLSLAEAKLAVLADELDGSALTVEHGAPWRLVVPGGACYTSVKWSIGWNWLNNEDP